jgi:predicted PurR-regulated permease PerM
MAIKTLVSLATGILVTIALAIIGVDYPILWGLLAFLLNFIPTFGSILAAVPPVLLAVVQLGVGEAFFIAIFYVLVNVIVGSVLEPRFMGRGLDLSSLVVFLSLVFWGWILGPVGMLLSVPLTIMVKIALENSEDTRWIGVMLGAGGATPKS